MASTRYAYCMRSIRTYLRLGDSARIRPPLRHPSPGTPLTRLDAFMIQFYLPGFCFEHEVGTFLARCQTWKNSPLFHTPTVYAVFFIFNVYPPRYLLHR